MKHLLIFIVTCILTVASYAQYFEGEVVYQNAFKCKIPGLSDEKFTSLMGTTQDYFVKGGWYKSVSNGELLQWQIYNPTDNKMYTKMSNNVAALWTDAGVNADSILSETINKAVVDIAGYTCDELILNCKSGTQKYYFNSKLAVDARLYTKHKYGNWYAFVSKSNAVPLKMEIDNAQFTMTSTAVEVKPEKLEASEFQLPAGTAIDKSPY